MNDFAHPEVLVDTEWLAANLGNDSIRIIEVDTDTNAYDEGHIPGALGWDWTTQLCDTLRRDIVPSADLQELLESSGISPESTVVLYGDNNNWFACWALWQLKMYGHTDLRILDGGRKKWIAEARELSNEGPSHSRSSYPVGEPDFADRAFVADVMKLHTENQWGLVDVRSPDEFSGRILAPPGLPETCQRGGHIPRSSNIPWGKNCNDDGTFKSRQQLVGLYAAAGLDVEAKKVITYCRIGERSSLSWFVLKYLVGNDEVINYDGSWTEWGNLVAAPIERGD